MESYTTGTGQEIIVHDRDDGCRVSCVIHNPSDHSMRHFPTHWRADRGLMERICCHGVGHPDPDDLASRGVHGCDGCCAPAESTERRALALIASGAFTKTLTESIREGSAHEKAIRIATAGLNGDAEWLSQAEELLA